MIRKHKSGCYKITLPIYLVSFYLALDNEHAEKLAGEDCEVEMGMIREFESDPPLMILASKTHEVIAHEVTHVTLILMHKLGIYPSYEDQEPMAYMMGYIAEQVYKCLDRHDNSSTKGEGDD